MHFKNQRCQIEDSYWPEYQDSMARVVWKDIHTFRSEMCKTIAGFMVSKYKLYPPPLAQSQEERIAAVKVMSAPLAYKFQFLQGEVDGNIKGYLDKLHKQGFISKSALVDQNKVDYIAMDKVLEKVASDPYYGHKLTQMLENWAQEGM
ncbi:hypothetical protein BS17DRAFT_770560 [Gyrodon lividus]|nr:hypothetical protein BS17DRAFT_770560 [Gyrodon lividus]